MNSLLRSLLRQAGRLVFGLPRARLSSRGPAPAERPAAPAGSRGPAPSAPHTPSTSSDPSRPASPPHTAQSERGQNGRRNGGEPSPYGAESAHEYTPGAELPRFDYEPHDDGDADPGEVVWTWVPFEDDPTIGKDRPALVLARIDEDVVIAQLTSKDRDLDRADEARWGRYWLDIGTGDWDTKRRDSEVRIDRLLRVGQGAIRREGGVLDHEVFLTVIEAVQDAHRRGL